jgi:DNA-binding CsgD family transcriptional regulator
MISSAAGVAGDVEGRGWNGSELSDRPLTPHEIRIVGMLAGGDSYQTVADRLGVTVNTVRNYIRSIYDKLRVHTKSEAVSKALRARIIY